MGGEHDSDPSSVEFCHLVGMDYMSCSPFRFPIARLAGAQAVVKEKKKEERRKKRKALRKRGFSPFRSMLDEKIKFEYN